MHAPPHPQPRAILSQHPRFSKQYYETVSNKSFKIKRRQEGIMKRKRGQLRRKHTDTQIAWTDRRGGEGAFWLEENEEIARMPEHANGLTAAMAERGAGTLINDSSIIKTALKRG